jgi:glycosyltransferase involved in cell wall biosynthesis
MIRKKVGDKRLSFGNFDHPIETRIHFILKKMENSRQAKKCQGISQCFDELAKQTGGSYWLWVALTGCYPTKREYTAFQSNINTSTLENAAIALFKERQKNQLHGQAMALVTFTSPKAMHLADVTHTYSAPYLTGIQRVVREIIRVSSKKQVLTFRMIGNLGILVECELGNQLDSSLLATGTEAPASFKAKIVHWMQGKLPALSRNTLGRIIYILALPTARKLKQSLLNLEYKKMIENGNLGSFQNICVLGKTLTILEFPGREEYIQLYEVILEQNITKIQIVSYDFIPIFHSWSVHPGNRGHFNNYLRLILLANKVVAISALVRAQAELLTQAFYLERKEWGAREREVVSLTLPSGFEVADNELVEKDSRLFVMLGSIEPRKNHLQFLDAVRILHGRRIYVKARLLGSAGWENDHILQEIEALQRIGVDIERLSVSDVEVMKYVSSARALLQISEAEGFGLPIAEARALGTAVIVSDISPLNDIYGEMPHIVKLGDPNSLADMIEGMIHNPDERAYRKNVKVSWEDWSEMLFS